jgi:hypothetical protein
VKNLSRVAAHNVNVVKVSERTYRTKLISLAPSRGKCTIPRCALGRIPPGGSVTITAVTLATKIGPILNVVRVGSEEKESNYLNNTASALARVVGPFRPPPQKPACRTLGAAPKNLRAGTTSIVLTTARNRFGAPVPGVTVHVRGAGVSASARTDTAGIARFTVTPLRPGFVVFRGSLRTTSTAAPICRTFLAALAAKPKPASVTG